MAKSPEPSTRQKLVLLLPVLWAVITVVLSCQFLAPETYLIREYGWSKVSNERLHVIAITKQKPSEYSLKISNGDTMDVNAFYFGIVAIIFWLPLTAIPWLLVARYIKAGGVNENARQ
jgi:hypothetical protein